MKKKIVELLVIAMLVVSCAACGNENGNTNESTKENGENGVEQKNDNNEEKSDENVVSTDYKITILGEEYTFPMSYDEFIAHGWEYYNPENADPSQWGNGTAGLASKMSGGDLFYNNGDMTFINIFFYNPTDEFATYDKCQVVGFYVDYSYDYSEYGGKLNVPEDSISINGLVIDKATKEEVYTTLGDDWLLTKNPEMKEDLSQVEYLAYYFNNENEVDVNNHMFIEFDENGIFHEIQYLNVPEE